MVADSVNSSIYDSVGCGQYIYLEKCVNFAGAQPISRLPQSIITLYERSDRLADCKDLQVRA
jgi:hypothetical protein